MTRTNWPDEGASFRPQMISDSRQKVSRQMHRVPNSKPRPVEEQLGIRGARLGWVRVGPPSTRSPSDTRRNNRHLTKAVLIASFRKASSSCIDVGTNVYRLD